MLAGLRWLLLYVGATLLEAQRKGLAADDAAANAIEADAPPARVQVLTARVRRAAADIRSLTELFIALKGAL